MEKDKINLEEIFCGCKGYYDLYDLFNNLVDYTENENDERTVENFLNHYETKRCQEWYERNVVENPFTIETEYSVLGNEFCVCCALMFIDPKKYFEAVHFNENCYNSMMIYLNATTLTYIEYNFQSEEEEKAWNEYEHQEFVKRCKGEENNWDNTWKRRKEWLEKYRKEHKNEN